MRPETAIYLATDRDTLIDTVREHVAKRHSATLGHHFRVLARHYIRCVRAFDQVMIVRAKQVSNLGPRV